MARIHARHLLAMVLVVCAAAGLAAAQERSLYWRSLDVTARLDREGTLHVSERQAFVFTGDWNGGERAFRVAWGQDLELESVTREDPITHERVLVQEGDLDVVDRYAWHEGTTLRWRSRRASDPPYDGTEIVYFLDYRLSGILVPIDGGGFVLDHDFAFPDRAGPIEAFSLELSLDGVWDPPVGFTGHVTRGTLAPGESVVLSLPLLYRGEGTPSGVRLGASRAARMAMALAIGLGVFAMAGAFYAAERTLGRFEPLDPLASIDRGWLDAHLFSLLPEEVGAAWDDRTAAPEVAAVLARMVAEGKLSSEVYRTSGWFSTRENLRLELLARRSSLSGYERSLVDALFFSGSETSTEAIREHYENKGFDPASKIRASLKRNVDRWLGRNRKQPAISKKRTLSLLAAAALLALVAAMLDVSDLVAFLVGAGALLGLYGMAAGLAASQRRRIERFSALAWALVLPAGLLVLFALVFVSTNPFRSGMLALAAIALVGLAFVNSVFNLARSRDGAETIAKRKKLAAARRYFQWELSKARPRLEDAWFPYFLAFGLGPSVDRWFGAHGGEAVAATAAATSSGGSRAGTGGGAPSWTGGGGAFGGAGASGSWAAAVGSVASGVAAPSSSSSGGGGGGGGGGSSGGGGGGGW